MLGATFRSLSSRNLRYFYAGQVISVIGTWVQKAAQAWLVLELTGSGVVLGITAALQELPILLMGMWGGVLADRFDKRRVLLITHAVAALPALALGVLTLTGAIELWMVFVLALAVGIVEALDKPARFTIVAELVEPDRLVNAVALNSIVQNAGKVGGPAVAGLLIVGVGLPVTFFVNVATFLVAIVGLALVRPELAHRAPPGERGSDRIRDGIAYVWATPALLGPLVLMAVTGALAYEWQVTLPLLAHDSFGGDPRIFGFMFAAMGLGAVIGGLALAGLLRSTLRALVVAGLLLAVTMSAAALAPALPVLLALLFLVGAASMAFRAVATTYVQLTAAPHMRGRVIALLVIAFTGTTPLGGPLVGWFGDAFGARAALHLGAASTAAAALVTYVLLRKAARRAEAGAGAPPPGLPTTGPLED